MNKFDPKQPWEEYYLSFDFTKDLDGEPIASATVTAEDANGEDVTSTLIDDTKQLESGSVVYFWARGGVHGTKYKFTGRVIGTQGSKYELDGTLKVNDI